MVGCRVVVGVIGADKHAGVITFCKKPSFGFEIASVSSNVYGNSPKSRKMFSVLSYPFLWACSELSFSLGLF